MVIKISPQNRKNQGHTCKIHKYFRQAKTAREEADYELLKKFSRQETEEIINTASDFIKFIKDNIL